MMKRLLPLLTIVLSGAMMAGCDALAGALGVDKVDVPLTGVGTLAVNGTAVSVEAGSSTRTGGKLPNLFDIGSIDIDPAKVHFTSSVGKTAASGNIYVTLFLGPVGAQYPLGSGTITIVNNAVTAVSESVGAVVSTVQTRCAAAGSGCPPASTYNGKSVSQIKDEVENYLRTSTNLNYSIVVTADAGVAGTVTIDGITINLDF